LLPNFYALLEGTDRDEREGGGSHSASSKILRLESFMLCYQIFTLYLKALTEMRERFCYSQTKLYELFATTCTDILYV